MTNTLWQAWRAEAAAPVIEQFLAASGQRAWVVGGAVRDALLGRDVTDWDILCSSPRELAEALATGTGGRLLELHAEPATFRVVLEAHTAAVRVFDLIAFRGPTLETDLAARDFTINALAAEIPEGDVVDPLAGLGDLQAGLIRTPARANLHADPLRCLRAYRFHAELGFTIAPETREYLLAEAPRIWEAAGERVGEELLKLLGPPRCAATVEAMAEGGLLWALFPELAATQGVLQGGFHHLDVWGHTVEVVRQTELLLADPGASFPGNGPLLDAYLAKRQRPALLLLAALLHDIAKPICLHDDGSGRTRFFGHEVEGQRLARHYAGRLALPTELQRGLETLVHYHMRPILLANLAHPEPGHAPQTITQSALRRLERDSGGEWPGLMLLALADVRSCRGPATRPGYHDALAATLDEMASRTATWEVQAAAAPLLRGRDLLAAGFVAGPRLGRLLRLVDEAWADGLVSTTAEAVELARRLEAELAEAGEEPAQGET